MLHFTCDFFWCVITVLIYSSQITNVTVTTEREKILYVYLIRIEISIEHAANIQRVPKEK